LKQIHADEKGRLKTAVAAILQKLKNRPPPDLRVACFGPFRVWRGDRELRPEQWPGEKPKLLFKYLCSQYSRGFVAKERILETLWPDEDPRVTRKRLHVALTKLRQSLEPELTRGLASLYLARKGDGYRLNLGPSGRLDIDLFDQALAAAQKESNEDKAFNHYLHAESFYGGSLFAEDEYMQWCSELREQYQAKYLGALTHVISGYRRAENWSKCIDFARKYVAADPYAEEMYQALMIFHNAAGNRSMIVKTYEQCKARIENELDALLSEETTELFKQLVTM
jgi:LuxR family transcriptional regulator, maltose regulon positive regulatory protein